MTAQEVNEYFRQHINCSQIVLAEFSEELGYERDEALRMAAAFGGGAGLGDTCGAVAGAYIAIGMKYGNDTPGDAQKAAQCNEEVKGFQDAFCARNSSLICRELLGCDFSIEGKRAEARESGLIFEKCPKFVLDAIDILQERGF